MSCGVMVGSLSLVTSFLLQMFMRPVILGRSKSCGTRSQLGFRRWGGRG
ncbi:hypothetical protein A2U01_0070831, partial [Trifolium medium]|nr:hypothetical protein [Trifolium medium]